MSKRTIRNWGNYDHTMFGETPDPEQKSMTIPNQTLSLKELVKRHVRGLATPQLEPVYLNDSLEAPMPDISRMTRQEKQDLHKELQVQIRAEQQAVLSAREAAKKEKEESTAKLNTDDEGGQQAKPDKPQPSDGDE